MMLTKIVHHLHVVVITLAVFASSGLVASAADLGMPAQATGSLTFTPVADAYVIQTNPSTNYGTSSFLRADSSPITRSYLRFTVTGLNGAQILSAKIRLYSSNSNTSGITLRPVTSNTWAETSITYSNAPVPGGSMNSSSAISGGTWVTVDVSAYVRAEGTYSLAVTTVSSTNTKLSSRETGAKSPQLVVTTQSGTTPTPTSTIAYTSTPTRTPIATSQPTQTPTTAPTSDWQPSFPIRAAFYYPWFPQAWTQSGIFPYTNYTPLLGYYSSTDQAILQQHLDMMRYGNIQAGIASWWGQGTQTDTKISGLLMAAAGSRFRWALYYENESQTNPTVSQIQNDLTYIRDHYGNDPSFLRVNGKFVMFVYPDGSDACSMADRWKQANTVGAYIVLKVFAGYTNCASQPDSWHQYSPAVASDQQGTYSYSISPGFWQKSYSVRLARDVNRWTQNVRDMVASGAKWQLVTTFSEWGEGTIVEPALEWPSASGYGQYLDALHYNGNMP